MTITFYVVHKYDSDGRYVSTFDELCQSADEAEALGDGVKGCRRPGSVHMLVEAVKAVVDSPSPPDRLPTVEPLGPCVRPARRTPAVS